MEKVSDIAKALEEETTDMKSHIHHIFDDMQIKNGETVGGIL